VLAVAIRTVFGGVGAKNHGSQRGEAGSNDSDGVLDHGNRASQHRFVAFRVISSDDCIRLSAWCCRQVRDSILLAIITKKPRAKMAPTPILSLSFIWSRETIVIGKQMMIASVKMLTEDLRLARVQIP
jgi:hypothetical protein